MAKIIMPQDIFYEGKLYYKNVMYDITEEFAAKVQLFREREMKELTLKAELDAVEKEAKPLTPKETKELEEAVKEEIEDKPVARTRRKTLEDA